LSWQLSSLLLALLAVVAGFFWYERTKPNAKTVALVATLAALAAIGRIGFAAVPNVTPTTDIVFIAGFILGGAAGFTVGSTAAFTSNLLLGQGPWTPWQMVAWGVVGVLGSLFASAVKGRLPNRYLVATLCAFSGLLYGAFLDLFVWLQLTGGGSFGKYLGVAAVSLPFNIFHAAGNFIFYIAFGPILIRMIKRFKARLEINWKSPESSGQQSTALTSSSPFTLVLLLVLAVSAALPAAVGTSQAAVGLDIPNSATGQGGVTVDSNNVLSTAATSPLEGANSSVMYLADGQNSDGGFGPEKGKQSSQLYTAWASLAFAAAGINPRDITSNGHSPISYIRRNIKTLDKDPSTCARTVWVLKAAGIDPKEKFAGRNFVKCVLSFRGSDGSYGGLVNATASSVLALRAAGYSQKSPYISRAASYLVGSQNDDGGFGLSSGRSDVDITGLVLNALVKSGLRNRESVTEGVKFLKRKQNNDGGFSAGQGVDRGGDRSNVQSTAFASLGLAAAGNNLDQFSTETSDRSIFAYISSVTQDSGQIRYSYSKNVTPIWTTSQALITLNSRSLPIAAPARFQRPKQPDTEQQTGTVENDSSFDGGFGGGVIDDGFTDEFDSGSDSFDSGGSSSDSSDSASDKFDRGSSTPLDETTEALVDEVISGPMTPLTYDPKNEKRIKDAGSLLAQLAGPIF